MQNSVFNISEITKILHDKFQFLEPAELELLLNKSRQIILKNDEILFHQGDSSNSFFIILKGQLRTTKHVRNKKIEHILTDWKSGDIVGEISLIDHSPRTVTVKAIEITTVLEFPVEIIKQNPELFNKISHSFYRNTARRLRFLTEVTVRSMEKQIQENKKRYALGLLMITVLTFICTYTIGLPFLEHWRLRLPVTTLISAPLVFILVIVMLVVMKKSGFPYKTFGLSTKNWRQHIIEAILFSIPIIIILMVAKWIVLHFVLQETPVTFFNPKSSLPGHFSWSLYWVILVIYILISPGQELIVRGALQSGFYIFLQGSKKKRLWIAIIISNLVFSIPHLYSSSYFALIVLIPGFFWGWLYARQKTLIGVSVSHIFIGVWMIFIIGFEQLLEQLGSFF